MCVQPQHSTSVRGRTAEAGRFDASFDFFLFLLGGGGGGGKGEGLKVKWIVQNASETQTLTLRGVIEPRSVALGSGLQGSCKQVLKGLERL